MKIFHWSLYSAKATKRIENLSLLIKIRLLCNGSRQTINELPIEIITRNSYKLLFLINTWSSREVIIHISVLFTVCCSSLNIHFEDVSYTFRTVLFERRMKTHVRSAAISSTCCRRLSRKRFSISVLFPLYSDAWWDRQLPQMIGGPLLPIEHSTVRGLTDIAPCSLQLDRSL